jgi:hypothetical protein
MMLKMQSFDLKSIYISEESFLFLSILYSNAEKILNWLDLEVYNLS